MSERGIVSWFERGAKMIASAILLSSTFLLMAPQASAAPQILGLAATSGPVELNCRNGECAAEFTVFCLQKERKSPGFEAPYELAADQDLTLTLLGRDGAARRVAAGDLLRVATTRGYSSVRISLAQTALAALGAVRATITVGARVTLLPIAEAGDLSPLTADEIAFASGPGRAIASGYFDGEAGPAGAVRVLTRVINAVDKNERMTSAKRSERWQAALSTMTAGADGSARALADEQFSLCQAWLDKKLVYGLRRCLEGRHDSIMRDANMRFWKSLEPGS